MTRRIALSLLILGMFLLILSIVIVVYSLNNPSAPLDLPDLLAGMKLSHESRGETALLEIAQLHRSSFPIQDGAVGIYGDSSQITVWAAQAGSERAAEQLIGEMVQSIQAGTSPFVITGQVERGGRLVLVLSGMGQTHYLFRSKGLVIWMAVDPVVASAALTDLQRFYP